MLAYDIPPLLIDKIHGVFCRQSKYLQNAALVEAGY